MTTEPEKHTLKVGETLKLVFNENSGCGYLWEVSPYNNAIVEISHARPEADTEYTDETAIGGGGNIEFTLIAKAPGVAAIEFTHKRPWQPDKGETRNYILEIQP